MTTARLSSRIKSAFQGRSRGFTMIEVVIAMLLLGMVGMAVLTSLSYASTVLVTVDRRATAESVAKTQMEYVKSQGYFYAPKDGVADNYTKASGVPPGYTVWTVNRDGQVVNGGGNERIMGIPWDSGNNTAAYEDVGLQKITVVIKYEILRYDPGTQKSTKVGQTYTLEDYKRDLEA